MKNQPSTLNLFFMLLLSIGFVILGIFAITQNGLIPKLTGFLCILFFGPGSMALGWQFVKGNKFTTAVIELKKPQSIIVKQNKKPDEEVLEQWYRACKLTDKDLQTVSAVKWDQATFPWAVDFGAAAFIREEPYAGILENDLSNALKKVPGVKDAVREDTEKWLVDGDTSGEALVRAGAVAVDKFLRKYRNKL